MPPTLLSASRNLRHRIRAAWRLAKNKLLELNLFTSELTWTDDHRRQKEIFFTRLYIVILAFAITILIVYTSISLQVQRITVHNPSLQTIRDFQSHAEFSSTLICPCQSINIPYGSFISIIPEFHQLCTSDFVRSNFDYIQLFYQQEASLLYPHDDYHIFAIPHARMLESSCKLANQTLVEALSAFISNSIVSDRAQSPDIIEAQAQIIAHRFRTSTTRTFRRTLDLVRHINQGNGIVSSIHSNWHFHSLNISNGAPLWSTARSYGQDETCSCGTNPLCTSPATMDGFDILGFRVGCYPLEALMQSTLACLYNTTCIERLTNMYYTPNIHFPPLDPTLTSENDTVQSLIDALMIHQWNITVDYEQYYLACSPLLCTYTIIERLNIVYVVTVIIGLYGGLTAALQLMVPAIGSIVLHVVAYRRRRIQPKNNTNNNRQIDVCVGENRY